MKLIFRWARGAAPAIAVVAIVTAALAQSPSPQPTPAGVPPEAMDYPSPTPTPTPAPSPSPARTPGSGGEASPSSTPAFEGAALAADPSDAQALGEEEQVVEALSEPGADAEDLGLDLPAYFADPGLPPAPPLQPNLADIAPSPKTIEKYNAEANRRIAEFVASQYNPDVSDLNLDAAIQVALRQNPSIIDVVERIRLTRGQVIEVRAQALPQLNAIAAFSQVQTTFTDPKVPDSGSATLTLPDGQQLRLSGGASRYQNPQAWQVGFQASQLLYEGGGVIAGIRAARFVEDSAYFELRQTVNDVIAAVKIQFFQVILNRALIVAQQQSVELLAQQLKDQENRYEAGTVPRFNVLQAEVALANAQPPLIQALNALRISQYELVRLLGMDYPPAKPSEVPFNVVGQLDYQVRAINADESIRTAIERNPRLKAQRQALLAQAENVKVQFAGYLPTISATADYTWQNNQAFQSLGEVTQGWMFGFQGSWAIFDGFATKGRVDQARAQLAQAVNNYNDGVRVVILDVQEAISNLQTALETVQSQEASVVQAAEAFRLSQERLDAGAGTQLDVLNAQTQLLQAQTNVLTARYDYIDAMAQYDRALSLDAQYEETFNDPLTAREKAQFQKRTDPTAPQPPLPPGLRSQDPIEGLAANAPVYPAATAAEAEATQAATDVIPGATPTPTPARRRPPRPPGR